MSLKKGLLISIGLCPDGHSCNGGYFKGIIDDVVVFNVTLDKAKIGNEEWCETDAWCISSASKRETNNSVVSFENKLVHTTVIHIL